MNRDKDLVKARQSYIKRVVSKSKSGTTYAVEKLSKQLFLSKATVYSDLAKPDSK